MTSVYPREEAETALMEVVDDYRQGTAWRVEVRRAARAWVIAELDAINECEVNTVHKQPAACMVRSEPITRRLAELRAKQ